MPPELVGLTGCIGSGKSTVAGIFKEKGVACIDADQVARELLAPGQRGWQALQAALAPRFFLADGSLDRKYLRQQIFSDHKLRHKIDSLLHPLIRQQIRATVSAKKNSPTIVEVPLLFEAGWQDDFDEIIVVSAGESQCLERLVLRDGVSLQDGKSSIAAQMPLAEKRAKAQHVLNNTGDMAALESQVDNLLHLWRPARCATTP